ncbi:MAG TPA: hypothetical protein VGG26_09045 [Terracidiphilus sp.]|jgi:hypothetical protein
MTVALTPLQLRILDCLNRPPQPKLTTASIASSIDENFFLVNAALHTLHSSLYACLFNKGDGAPSTWQISIQGARAIDGLARPVPIAGSAEKQEPHAVPAVELRALRILSASADWMSQAEIQLCLASRAWNHDQIEVNSALCALHGKNLARFSEDPATSPTLWIVTLAGNEYLKLNDDNLKPPPAAVCNTQEPDLADVATVCLTGAELDKWWNGLDVECKADAFIGLSLRIQGQAASHIDCSDTRITVSGTVGESPEQWNLLREKVAAAQAGEPAASVAEAVASWRDGVDTSTYASQAGE